MALSSTDCLSAAASGMAPRLAPWPIVFPPALYLPTVPPEEGEDLHRGQQRPAAVGELGGLTGWDARCRRDYAVVDANGHYADWILRAAESA